ncbi:DUF4131 domain-containing protein [Candidatus Peregrinibacteria bacterium]|jgi:competence protein ComEC|nr:DUF4131 domain-containing protein [Candidatus Peregrinibacteria bacterium]MBT4148102.1 DUF4131 domain-containing protein [Candidatus Peregrinibacteria bacterium]MBT4456444.1 DUF4131 domain-containing protein [Candidatus Peregrinibacteria bacterium]
MVIFFMIGFLIGVFFAAQDVMIGVVFLGLVVWVFVRKGVVVGLKILLVIMLGVCFGVGRFLLAEISFGDDVSVLNGTGEFSMTGCVSGEVDVRADRVKYTLTEVVISGEEGRVYGGKLLVNAAKYPVYEYGDVLSVVGGPVRAEKIDDFDYGKYLERYGIYSMVNNARVMKVGDGCGSLFFEGIYDLKGKFEEKVSRIYSEPHGSMVAGLLLGVRKGIPEELTLDFNETGLTHIVAISGYNITLVILVVFGMFGFLGRRARVVVASLFVFVFVVLVGASSAVVRAGIMGVIGLFALYFGRQNQVGYAVVLTAFFMNLWNPKVGPYDVGFQLSFLATLGLIYVSPVIEKAGGVFGRALSRVPVMFAVRENLIMTLSAQTFALPVILRSFGRFSLICPLANIFVLPFIPLIMLSSFVAIVLSFVSEGLGEKVSFVSYFLLEIVFFLVRVFAELSRTL